MKKYKKPTVQDSFVLGMLHIIEVRLVRKASKETIKHRILVVGSEADDISRKVRWMFDSTEYCELSITKIEKVREKMHFLSTTILQDSTPTGPVIRREDSSVIAPQVPKHIEAYDPILFAVGVVTTMLAKDRDHAIRKVGRALINSATEGSSHSGAALNADSTVTVEAIPKNSGYALPRDVSNESNLAHMVRG